MYSYGEAVSSRFGPQRSQLKPVLGLWHFQSRARTGMGICYVYHDPQYLVRGDSRRWKMTGHQ